MTVVYRRERKDMPAIAEEIVAAEHEGARIAYLAAPHRIVGDRDGRVVALEAVRTRPGEFDTSGRRRPVPTDEVIRFECDTVILAVGESVDLDFCAASGLKVRETKTLEVDRYTLETSRDRFYAGGDLITGASNVSNAMGLGKKAARTIHRRLTGREDAPSVLPGVQLRDGAAGPAQPRQAAGLWRDAGRRASALLRRGLPGSDGPGRPRGIEPLPALRHPQRRAIGRTAWPRR